MPRVNSVLKGTWVTLFPPYNPGFHQECWSKFSIGAQSVKVGLREMHLCFAIYTEKHLPCISLLQHSLRLDEWLDNWSLYVYCLPCDVPGLQDVTEKATIIHYIIIHCWMLAKMTKIRQPFTVKVAWPITYSKCFKPITLDKLGSPFTTRTSYCKTEKFR